jgi:transcriptional regulator with XRE-family HTH domain
MSNKPHNIGAKVRAFREAKGLSQHELAKAARIGRSTLVLLENGANARLQTIASVGKVLGFNVDPVSAISAPSPQREARLQQALRVKALQIAHLKIGFRLMSGESSAVAGLGKARSMVDLWARDRTCSPLYVEKWKEVLEGTPQEVGAALFRLDEDWESALLQNTPFGALLAPPP